MVRLILLLLALLVTAASATAQQPVDSGTRRSMDPRQKSWNDYGGLVVHLHNRGYRFLEGPEELDPGRSLLVLVGASPSRARRLPRRVRDFLYGGGRLLVASDRSSVNRFIRPGLGVDIWGETASVDRSSATPAEAYRGFDDCPIIPISDDSAHPILRGLQSIALNRPSFLDSGRLEPVLRYPYGCTYATAPLVVAGSARQGSIVVIADHSMFINAMIVAHDNVGLLDNSLDWLEAGTPITEVLLYCDGTIQKPPLGAQFDLSSLDKLPSLAQVNLLISKLERTDFWSRKLSGKAREAFEVFWYSIDQGLLFGLILLTFALIAIVRRPVTPDVIALRKPSGSPHFLALRARTGVGKTIPPNAVLALLAVFRRRLARALDSAPEDEPLRQGYDARINEPRRAKALAKVLGAARRLERTQKSVKASELRDLRAAMASVLEPLAERLEAPGESVRERGKRGAKSH